ncbi:hypothetical protein DSECCO2_487060 [anaerobic digester metagenome]
MRDQAGLGPGPLRDQPPIKRRVPVVFAGTVFDHLSLPDLHDRLRAPGDTPVMRPGGKDLAGLFLTPDDLHLVRPKARPDLRLIESERDPVLQHDLTRVGDHRTVVAEERPLRDGERRSPVLAHDPEHLLQPCIRPDAAHKQHLVLPGMGERALGHLDAHRKRRLLQPGAGILEFRRALLGGADEPGEGEVHPLHRIGKIDVVALPGKLLDDRAARVREVVTPGELIERVPQADIQRLPEYPVAAV